MIVLCKYVNEQFALANLKKLCYDWLTIELILRRRNLTLGCFEVD